MGQVFVSDAITGGAVDSYRFTVYGESPADAQALIQRQLADAAVGEQAGCVCMWLTHHDEGYVLDVRLTIYRAPKITDGF